MREDVTLEDMGAEDVLTQEDANTQEGGGSGQGQDAPGRDMTPGRDATLGTDSSMERARDRIKNTSRKFGQKIIKFPDVEIVIFTPRTATTGLSNAPNRRG